MKRIRFSLLALMVLCTTLLSACGREPITISLIDLYEGDIGCGDALVAVEDVTLPPSVDPEWLAILKYLDELDHELYTNPLYKNIDFQEIIELNHGADLTAAIDFDGACDEPRIQAMLDAIGKQINFKYTVTF